MRQCYSRAVRGRERVSFRLDDGDQSWPLLFHLEPLLASYQMGEISVTVLDEQGKREFADVASAQAGSREHPPHRVELYLTGNGVRLIGLWLVGFGPGQEAAVTVADVPGMDGKIADIRASIAEFLDEDDVTAAPAAAPAVARGWGWMLNQPWTVQVIGGVIATVVAAGILALITALLD
jgi:hypothetical protein